MSDKYSTAVFTDGGSRGNPGRGGWAYVYVVNDEIINEEWGGEDHTTNNRMELTAIIKALQKIGNQKLTLFSDSKLCVQSYNEWMDNWEKKGWKKKTGPIKNLDLIQELYQLKQECPLVKIEWIPGHAGHRWNEYVDKLTQKY